MQKSTENADTRRNSVKKRSEPESMPVASSELGGGHGGQGGHPNKKTLGVDCNYLNYNTIGKSEMFQMGCQFFGNRFFVIPE